MFSSTHACIISFPFSVTCFSRPSSILLSSHPERQRTLAESNLKRTDDRIREINEQIHYAGQYLSTRSVNKEYQKSFVKPLYRHQHEKDLDRYDEAVQYFRKKGLKIPALKDLKQQKEDLLARKSVQENELRSLISYRNDVRTAAINVNWILSEDRVRRQNTQRTQPFHSENIER